MRGGWEGDFLVSAGEGPVLLSALQDNQCLPDQWERDSPKVN